MNIRALVFLLLSSLLIMGGLWMRSYESKKFRRSLPETIRKNLEREYTAINREAVILLHDSLVLSTPAWDDAQHFFIRVDHNRIVAWNRNYFLPDIASLPVGDSIVFLKSVRGDFLVKRWPIHHSSALYNVLKLADRYPITNNFLSAQNEPSIFPVKDIQIMSPLMSIGDAVYLQGHAVFRILHERSEIHESNISFLMLLTALLLLLVALDAVRVMFEKSGRYDAAFLVLLTGWLAVRHGMIAINLPALYFQADVFDPKQFASSFLNASLGDLFFNAIALLFLMVYLSRNLRKFLLIRWLFKQRGTIRNGLGTVILLICFFAFLFPFDFIETIYHNSTLSFDGAQSLTMSPVRIVALGAVLAGCISSFLFIHLLVSLATHLFDDRNRLFFAGLLGAALLFIIQSYLLDRNLWVTLSLGVLFFSVLKVTGINKGAFHFSFRLFTYLIFSVVMYSLQNAWAVRVFYKEKLIQDQFRFGKDFLTERDVLGEYLLDQARQRIRKDQFVQFRMATPFLNKSAVADKISRVYLSTYFDRYETKIVTWNQEEESNEFLDSISHGRLSFLPTGYDGISYASTADGTTVRRYHVTIPIYYQRPVGTVELDLSLKRVIPDNVYPELLVDNRFKQIYRNRNFSYAVFTQNKLVSSSGPFNYERDFRSGWISSPYLFTNGVNDGRYYHIGIEESDGSVAVVSSVTYSWFYFIANFSFWFALGLIVLFIWQGITGLRSYLAGEHVNYTTRIQLFIFLAFLLPVLAVSITTLTMIGRSNEEAIQQDYLEKSSAVSQRLAGILSADSTSSRNQANLEKWIVENAASSKIDISMYSPQGILMATSQPALFDNQLISPLMNRQALDKIVLLGEAQTVTGEQIGRLQYSCAYSAVLSPLSGRLEGIVGLPFFESATYLEKSQSLILSNILIVFVVVFILFSLLSFWASSSLTFPIRFITKTLSLTTLTGENKPLRWRSSDEIGMLVKEYNRMVSNLEESKQALARSEKETAWREMAKQVAHEIKNPLTPMKLTLQQLEQALKAGTMPPEKSQKSLEVLLKQVDILNEIAVSFSSFASMPASRPQDVELHGVLQGAVNLFAAETNCTVTLGNADTGLLVSIDKPSFSRAISNIIINAIQAGRPEQDKLTVLVETSIKNDKVVIAISDNGKGMTEEVKQKVFQPQFTTKQSGSGLGLAMTQQIIKQTGGSIWFESQLDHGTTFYIELPLVSR